MEKIIQNKYIEHFRNNAPAYSSPILAFFGVVAVFEKIVASMEIFNLLLFAYFIPSILAVILGVKGLQRSKTLHGRGKIFAISSLIISFITLSYGVFLVIWLFYEVMH